MELALTRLELVIHEVHPGCVPALFKFVVSHVLDSRQKELGAHVALTRIKSQLTCGMLNMLEEPFDQESRDPWRLEHPPFPN